MVLISYQWDIHDIHERRQVKISTKRYHKAATNALFPQGNKEYKNQKEKI